MLLKYYNLSASFWHKKHRKMMFCCWVMTINTSEGLISSVQTFPIQKMAPENVQLTTWVYSRILHSNLDHLMTTSKVTGCYTDMPHPFPVLQEIVKFIIRNTHQNHITQK